MLSESFDLYLFQKTSMTNIDEKDELALSASDAQTQKTTSSGYSSVSEDSYLEVDISEEDADIKKDDEKEDDEDDIAEDKAIGKDKIDSKTEKEETKEASTDSIDTSSKKDAGVSETSSAKSSMEASSTSDSDKDGVSLKDFKKYLSSSSENDELAAVFGYDKLFDYVDEDGDGKISDTELENLGLDISDIKNLTTDNIREIAKLAGLPDLESEDDTDAKTDDSSDEISPELLEKLRKAFGITDDTDVQTTTTPVSGTSGGGYASGGGGVSGSGGGGSSGATSTGGTNTPDEMTMDELLAEQQTKQTALDEANSKVADVQSGENSEVKAAIDDADEKQEIYEKALEEDEEVSEELKERQKENQGQIEDTEKSISDKETAISEAEAKISNLESEISLIDNRISALSASLSALPAKTEDNESRHSEIDAMKASIEEQIASQESEKEAKETEISETEDKKADDEEELETLQGTLEELEEEREKIEKEILDSCSDETKQALEDWQNARENIETVKQEQLEIAQQDVEKAQTELDEVNNSIKELETMQIQLENRVGGEGEDVAEFALKLDGMSASEMKQIMQAAGCRFDDGAWCADFVTYVTRQIYGDDSTPGDFANSCSNTAYCPTVGAWARENGIYTTDSSQVEPGDYILYGGSGSEYHIGIVTSVNADGTVNTIEGNTSDDNGNYTNGVVNQHSNRTGAYVLMHELA